MYGPLSGFKTLALPVQNLPFPKMAFLPFFSFQAPEGALFSEPRLFRACVPPGIHRFCNNLWELESLPAVKRALGYPQSVRDDNPEMESARNIELDLGLQVLLLVKKLSEWMFRS